MDTITLSDGRLQHKTGDWIGIQNPDEPMTKTKWHRKGTKTWEVQSASKSKPGVVYTYTVIRDADIMTLPDIEKSILEYSEKAKEGKLTIEDMQGGTFTISNGGVFGSLLSTPILNAPQTAILGMHTIQDRAVVIDGKIEVRPMMYLALSYDHRLLDGKDAVGFLICIKEQLESPQRLLLNL